MSPQLTLTQAFFLWLKVAQHSCRENYTCMIYWFTWVVTNVRRAQTAPAEDSRTRDVVFRWPCSLSVILARSRQPLQLSVGAVQVVMWICTSVSYITTHCMRTLFHLDNPICHESFRGSYAVSSNHDRNVFAETNQYNTVLQVVQF